jgi:hypothetical protein
MIPDEQLRFLLLWRRGRPNSDITAIHMTALRELDASLGIEHELADSRIHVLLGLDYSLPMTRADNK